MAMQSMHGPTLPGGRGGGGWRRRKKEAKAPIKWKQSSRGDGEGSAASQASVASQVIAIASGAGRESRRDARGARRSGAGSTRSSASASRGRDADGRASAKRDTDGGADAGASGTGGSHSGEGGDTGTGGGVSSGGGDAMASQQWPIEHKAEELSGEEHYWHRRNRQIIKQGVAAETTLFRGCRIYFNGRAGLGGDQGRLELTAAIQRHGGVVGWAASSKITHIVGSNTTATKANQYLRHVRSGCACIGCCVRNLGCALCHGGAWGWTGVVLDRFAGSVCRGACQSRFNVFLAA